MTKNNPTIKEKMEQLDAMIAWFESDEFELEKASVKLKEAAKLVTEIEHDLGGVANDIQQVKKSFATESD